MGVLRGAVLALADRAVRAVDPARVEVLRAVQAAHRLEAAVRPQPLEMASEVLHPSASTAMTAASTARRSAAGIAR